ncbi:hypothetical protein LWI29_029841 [Acer saccharum]|uniref:Uncharacterized protein n=1 Tax=Acer saccharum TaxID=4024 RepID=A0AA39VME0_ACESA|nr:hypothetical protein LWI29_029841 [Acer saccharum]
MYPSRTPLLQLKLRTASNLSLSTKKSNLDGIQLKFETFRFNVKGTGSGRFHHAESAGGVGFLRFTTDRRRSDDNRSVQKTLTADLRIFRCSIDDGPEDNLEDCLFPLLLVVVVSLNSPAATGRRNGSYSTFVGRFDHFLVTTHSPWPAATSPAATVPAVAAPAARQLRGCSSGLLEPCATESSTLDPIHPKP